MYNAIRCNETLGSTVNLGSYAECVDAMNAIKADYVNMMFASRDAEAFVRSTSYDAAQMWYATYITACAGENNLTWYVEQE